MLSGIRRASARWEPEPRRSLAKTVHLEKFPNSFFSKSWPLPSKYCIAIAFRIAASRSHLQFDVPAVGRRRPSPVRPLGFFLSSTPMVAWPPGPPRRPLFLRSGFRVEQRLASFPRHAGARPAGPRRCAKDFRFASLQVLYAHVQALHRHGFRTGRRTLHRPCQGRLAQDGRGIALRAADTNRYWRARQYIE